MAVAKGSVDEVFREAEAAGLRAAERAIADWPQVVASWSDAPIEDGYRPILRTYGLPDDPTPADVAAAGVACCVDLKMTEGLQKTGSLAAEMLQRAAVVAAVNACARRLSSFRGVPAHVIPGGSHDEVALHYAALRAQFSGGAS